MRTEKVERLNVAVQSKGVFIKCSKCGQTKAVGIAGIEVHVEKREQPYLLGEGNATCVCGHILKMPELFVSVEKAQLRAKSLWEEIKSKNAVDLILLEMQRPSQN